jgi:hypothetical protein
MERVKEDKWNSANIQVFWGELAPCHHLVQIYENDKYFLDTLEGFVGTGFLAGDSVIIIATAKHLELLNGRLKAQDFNIDQLIRERRYFPLDAEEILAKFMIADWPDEQLFNTCIPALIEHARAGNRKVRAFGEMVALLWDKGLNDATVQLENLWDKLHEQDNFTLFCAYPKTGFTQCPANAINEICHKHSKVIDGYAKPATEITYRLVG